MLVIQISQIEKKITEHDNDKYITIPEYNKLTAENFTISTSKFSKQK